jgi:hypothetical protein
VASSRHSDQLVEHDAVIGHQPLEVFAAVLPKWVVNCTADRQDRQGGEGLLAELESKSGLPAETLSTAPAPST